MFYQLLISFSLLLYGSLTEVDRNFLAHTQLEHYSRVTTIDCGRRYRIPENICLSDAPPRVTPDGTLMPDNMRAANSLTTLLGEFPFMAAIQTVSESHRCGAILINKLWALTAAHCTQTGKTEDFHEIGVQIGSVSMSADSRGEYYAHIGIEKFVSHPNFIKSSKLSDHTFDIALVKLRTAFNNTAVRDNYIINSVCLPKRHIINKYSEMSISIGWGLQSSDSTATTSDVFLGKAMFKMLSTNNCDNLLRKKYNINQTDRFICVEGVSDAICEQNFCSTLIQYVDGRAVVIGIAVSVLDIDSSATGKYCANGFALFVRVSKHIDWIIDTIANN